RPGPSGRTPRCSGRSSNLYYLRRILHAPSHTPDPPGNPQVYQSFCPCYRRANEDGPVRNKNRTGYAGYADMHSMKRTPSGINEPLRVTHVTLSLDVGGLERNIVNQVREGHRLGQEVSVVCLERPGTLATQVEALGAPVICLHKRPGLRWELVGQLWRALRRLRPHIVHSHQIGSLFYTGKAAFGAGVPVVVHTEHGKQPYADRLRTRWLGRLAGCYASRFFCLSKDMAEAVKAHHIVRPGKV